MVDQYYEDMRDDISMIQSQRLELKKWKSSPALFDKSGKYAQPYSGKKFDPEKFVLVENGWDHDHCRFCWATISDCDHKKCVHEAYDSNCGWICPDCYQHLIVNEEDPKAFLESEKPEKT